MRVKAVIAYHGGHFQGFQRQTSTKNTVTSTIDNALKSLQINSPIVGSGRTDAGVHATGQVIHFDLPPFWDDLNKLTEHLNGRLEGIRFKHIAPAVDDFHARFSAKRRIYRYLFQTDRPSVFAEELVAHCPLKSADMLRKALRLFEGEHDFGYFFKTGSETKNNIRHIYRTHYRPLGNMHAIYFEANGFLRAQVRMMIHAALMVANGELTLEQLSKQITMTKRHTTELSPPQGLYLARVIY